MSIRIISANIVGNKGVVTFASDKPSFSDQIEELSGPEVKQAAVIEAAKHGMSKPSLTDVHQSAYPVRADGKPLENLLTEKVAYYLVDVRVVGSIL